MGEPTGHRRDHTDEKVEASTRLRAVNWSGRKTCSRPSEKLDDRQAE